MVDIARASGVTRQLLYFHFDGRTDLLVELARAVDAEVRTEDRQRKVDQAASGREALHLAVELQGYIKPRIQGIARAVERLRATDPAAAAAWNEREAMRYGRCLQLCKRLHHDPGLAAGLAPPAAARLMWSMTSQRAWSELVLDSGWSTKRWIKYTALLLEGGLLGGSA